MDSRDKKKHQWTKATKDTTKARTAGMNHVTEGIGERTRRHKKAIQKRPKLPLQTILLYRWTAGMFGAKSPNLAGTTKSPPGPI